MVLHLLHRTSPQPGAAAAGFLEAPTDFLADPNRGFRTFPAEVAHDGSKALGVVVGLAVRSNL